MFVKINPKDIDFSKKIQNYCLLPYDGHKKGCPNYKKKDGCPPGLPLIDKLIDFEREIYVIYTEFEIGKHAEKMKANLPNWSEKKLYCCLYWQPRARKKQIAEEKKALEELKIDKIVRVPEAYGVDVDKLMKNLGVELEWPPRKISRIVSIGGFEINK